MMQIARAAGCFGLAASCALGALSMQLEVPTEPPTGAGRAAELARTYPPDRNYLAERVKLIREKQGAVKGNNEFGSAWGKLLTGISHTAGMWDYAANGSSVLEAYKAKDPDDPDRDPQAILDSIAKMPGHYDAGLDAEGQRIVDQFLRSRLPEALDDLAGAWPMVPVVPVERPAIFQGMRHLGDAQTTSRFNAARMSLARRRGDDFEFVRAISHNLSIRQALARDASVMEFLVCEAIERLTLSRIVQEHLAKAISGATCRKLLPLLDWAVAEEWSMVLRCERLMLLDTVDWAYQTGRYEVITGAKLDGSPEEVATAQAMRKAWVSREEALAELDALMIPLAAEIDPDPAIAPEAAARSREIARKLEIDAEYRGRFGAIAAVMVPFTRLKTEELGNRTWISGVRAILAIEAFKSERGRLPETLAELVPDVLTEVPVDWLAASPRQPIRYLKIDPTKDSLGRTYLVYSVGIDGSDDQGKIDPEHPSRGFQPPLSQAKGYDFVVNFSESLPDRK